MLLLTRISHHERDEAHFGGGPDVECDDKARNEGGAADVYDIHTGVKGDFESGSPPTAPVVGRRLEHLVACDQERLVDANGFSNGFAVRTFPGQDLAFKAHQPVAAGVCERS